MNIAEQEFADDLHGSYRRLREQAPTCPVQVGAGREVWLITRYEVRSLIADNRLSSQVGDEDEDGGQGLIFSPISAGMETADPPKHERLRRSIRQLFGIRAVDSGGQWRRRLPRTSSPGSFRPGKPISSKRSPDRWRMR
ncbi:cytochrome P450 [Nonomuraea ceibae]|uniref:cytochrome P450 n=1 Tax=Nonomuraea ceibae TaxID=1935170 RepID=UPI001C5FD582|nr:cytochrome P450 [Nonomuraea ceibae]